MYKSLAARILMGLMFAAAMSPRMNANAATVHDPAFAVELYAVMPGSADGIAYSDGSAFPRGLYVTVTGVNAVYRVSAPNTVSVFATGLPYNRFEPAFDRSGLFNGDLFIAATENGSGPGDSIMRVTPSGQVTTFFTSGPNQLDGYAPTIAFGKPGSSFEGFVYIPDVEHRNLNRFDPSATRSAIAPVTMSRHEAKDIEFPVGAVWGDYIYMADAAAHQIRRVSTDASSSVFFTWDPATMANIRSIAFGSGDAFGFDLYGGNNAGEVFRIDPDGNPSLLLSGLGAKVFATEFGENELFVGTGAGEIYRVFPIPEPQTAVLFTLLVLTCGRRTHPKAK